jgi:glutaredoxin/cytochrome c biogenesis protein CcdA
MKIAVYAWLALGVFLLAGTVIDSLVTAQEITPSEVVVRIEPEYPPLTVFGRDDCGVCKQLFAYLEREAIPFRYLNINEDSYSMELYGQIITMYELPRMTPVMVLDETVFAGFNGERTTGKEIERRLAELAGQQYLSVEEHIMSVLPKGVMLGAGCTGIQCDNLPDSTMEFDLPLFGIVDLKSFSLFTLSFILGVIDGFNPCAMWVLITFLALLAQAGSRQKMIFLAGLFILAQGVMYNLILNVWYKTWDFIALDQIVTPLVGFIALGGGTFFLYRWYKNRHAPLVCDITSIDSQIKTVNRFKQIVNQPITIFSVLAILVIAFSVNIIEFACSIGIPQAYTKILELNMLTFLERQWYILVFTFGYMVDDVLVFALAIWGYGKLQAHGQKYAQHSLLIGGALMVLLGVLLIMFPAVLVL